ncbi:MAG TPA: FtsX-like permease family protein [Hyphomonadaceae bacterium]|nr:FtsX-like permease family protein [Hyphomonadaceae bacterium]
MFANYLKVALSDLARNWLYATISILGLAVSFAGGILVTQFVRNEFSYDRWIPDHERVFKLFHSIEQPGQPANSSDFLMAGVKKQLVEADPKSVAAAARLMQAFPVIFQNPDPGDGGAVDQAFSWADPEIFEVLQLPAEEGDLRTALSEPGTVVMTRAAAAKYFGRENVIGETLTLAGPNNSKIPLKVTAILRDLPSNTNLVTQIFASGKTAQTPLAVMDSRPPIRTGVSTYIFAKIAETATQDDLERAIDAATVAEAKAFGDAGVKTEFWAVPLSELHTTAPGLTGLVTKPTGSKTTAWAIAAVGALIVLVAGINFVTLMTARASRRALEVGVRKANGAKRSDLVVQFMGEALIYAVLSMVLAIILASALAQPFSDFVQRGIHVNFITDPVLAGSLILATLVIAFLGGLYPALVLSSFRPGQVLKGGAVRHSGSPMTRQVLVVVQFSILIGLILATVTIYRQTEFALKQGLGGISDQIIQVRTNCQNAFPAEVRKLPGVERAACSSLNALSSPSAKNITDIDTKDGRQLTFNVAPVDFEFFETFGIRPLAGRVFDRERGNDGPLPLQAIQQGTTVGQQPGQAAPPPQAPSPGAPGGPPPPQFGPRPVVLNQAAAISLGYATPEEAIGKTMSWSQPGAGPAPLPSEIIGVIPDLPVNVGAKAEATFYFIAQRIVSVLSIKTTGEDVAGTVREIQRVWKDTGNVRPIELTFYEQTRRTQYLDIIIQGALIGICAAAAIAIACLGLFALSALAAERKTKEIGIRKVLGATTPNVLGLLMWQFTIPVLWAIAIAVPVSWLLMANWLQGFAYHVDLPLWLFGVAALAALAIAWLTVSFQTYRVARAKPMTALRYE